MKLSWFFFLFCASCHTELKIAFKNSGKATNKKCSAPRVCDTNDLENEIKILRWIAQSNLPQNGMAHSGMVVSNGVLLKAGHTRRFGARENRLRPVAMYINFPRTRRRVSGKSNLRPTPPPEGKLINLMRSPPPVAIINGTPTPLVKTAETWPSPSPVSSSLRLILGSNTRTQSRLLADCPVVHFPLTITSRRRSRTHFPSHTLGDGWVLRVR